MGVLARNPIFLALLLSVPLACAADDKKGGATYKWVDENGVTHYGDHIPPQYAQKERKVLNRQGVETGSVGAQKSPEQLAIEAREAQERLRKKQHDSFLLNTYSSVKDIEQLRDLRLDQLRGQTNAAQLYINTLQERLAALQTRAMLFKPYSPRADARRIPDELAEDLIRALNELRAQTNALADKQQEEDALVAQFQTDIDRYRELRTGRR